MPFCCAITIPDFVIAWPYAQPTAAITEPVPFWTATSETTFANSHCAEVLVSPAQLPVAGAANTRLAFRGSYAKAVMRPERLPQPSMLGPERTALLPA